MSGGGPAGGGAPRLSLFDHHVHTDRSDGALSLASRARSVAVRPHGVSDHYPWRERMRDDDDVLRYVEDAAALGLRVGLEYDLGVAPPLRPATRDSLHYLIGAIHRLEIDGRWIAFDDAGAYMKGRRGTGPYADAGLFSDEALRRKILERTLAVVREGILDVGIDIVGHPTFSPLAALGDPEAALPAEWQERLIDLCGAHQVALEVNESYGVPHTAFLVRARRRGALFSVGSDAHGEIAPLERTDAMIRAAELPLERFLVGERVRPQAGSAASSS